MTAPVSFAFFASRSGNVFLIEQELIEQELRDGALPWLQTLHGSQLLAAQKTLRANLEIRRWRKKTGSQKRMFGQKTRVFRK